MLKLKCGSNFFNGVQALNFIHGFQRLVLYSTSSSSSAYEADPSSSLKNYLVEVLGFSPQQSLSTSSWISQFRNSSKAKNVSINWCKLTSNASLVTDFLKQNGFDESHIKKIILAQPRILSSKVDKTLKPKIELLREIGLSGSDLTTAVLLNPLSLCLRFNSIIQTFRQVLGCDENVRKALFNSWHQGGLSNHKYMIPNVELLQKYGIPIDIIQKHVMQDPESFVKKPLVFKDILIRAEQKIGISRDSTMFLYVIRVLRRCNEKQIETKFHVYKSFGWTRSDFLELIRRMPCCLGHTDATTKKKLGFLMKQLGYQPADLLSRGAFMTYSLEKRILPRYQVLVVLKDNGLIGKNFSFYAIISLNESKFVNKFVLPYEEVHNVYAKHAGVNAKLLTQGRADANSNMKKDSDTIG